MVKMINCYFNLILFGKSILPYSGINDFETFDYRYVMQ